MEPAELIQVAAIAAVLLVLWVLLDLDTYRERVRRVGRRVGLVAVAPPTPPGPPIEQIAADVRRIGSAIQNAPAGTPVARLRGWRAAYDDVLVAACRALELEQLLTASLPALERDLERERVERMLARTGLLADHDVER